MKTSNDQAIPGWVQSAMEKLRALRRDRQKVTGDEVSEAMVKAGAADGTWIGAVTMAAGMAWNWAWHGKRRDA
ncbi:MAG TPA: hypothetical protein VFE86_07375 [Ilumatobacteraceae bacterium]|nr:hypothetical protein [Ilumatobacteraceae bacterium]